MDFDAGIVTIPLRCDFLTTNFIPDFLPEFFLFEKPKNHRIIFFPSLSLPRFLSLVNLHDFGYIFAPYLLISI